MQLPKAVLRHISDSPWLSAALRHVRCTWDWLIADARSHSTAHQRWWAALAAVALLFGVLSLCQQPVVPAAEPHDGADGQGGVEQQHSVHSRRMSAVSQGSARAWHLISGNTMPAGLKRWSDFERDAPDEPAGHPARHVPSRLMHKQTVWYRSVIDNRTRLDAADTRAVLDKRDCGLLAAEAMVHKGTWHREAATGHLFWEPNECRLRRLTAHEARSCLAGRHIAFVGDSVSRFQFVSLAHFLAQTVFPERYGGSTEPSLLIEREIGGWDAFYKAVKEKLQLGVDASASATCDCNHETLVEHMEVRVTKAVGGGRWSKELPPITLTSNFSALNAVSNIQSALTTGVDWAAQHADVVMVNMGLWWMKHLRNTLQGDFTAAGPNSQEVGVDPVPVVRRIVEAGARSVGDSKRRPRSRLLWKTTTSVGMGGPYESGIAIQYFEPQVMSAINAWAIDAAAGHSDWGVLDTFAVTESAKMQNLHLSFDGLHFLPVVYEQMNDLLLNMLCDMDGSWAG